MSSLTQSFRNPVFAPQVAITLANFGTLADATTLTSGIINNSIIRYSEYLITIVCNGVAAATAWLDIRLLASTDGGATFQTWENGFVLPPMSFIVVPQNYSARILAPEYWQLAVRNNTGAALTAGAAFYQGIRK